MAKKIWIGFLEGRAPLVEEVERLLRTGGHEVTWRSYPNFPSGDYLGKLLDRTEQSHEIISWILEENEGRAGLEKELEARAGERYCTLAIADETISHGEDVIGPVTLDAAFALSRVLLGRAPL